MANFYQVNPKKSINNQVKKNITVNIEKLDLNGCGVAYYQKKPVFIQGALPSENVDIQIVEQKNKYSTAKLITICKANVNRVVPKCRHFSLCGGCDLQHLEYTEQLNFKQQKVSELFSRAGLPAALICTLPWQTSVSNDPWHYRRKARIGVQFDKNAQVTLGFRQKSTNQLVSVKSCPVLVEPAAEIFPILKVLINQLSVKKSIGHIELICTQTVNNNHTVNQITLVVRQIKDINEHDLSIWKQYADKQAWHVFFQENDNNMRHLNELKNYQGLHYNITDDIKINFSSSDFIQINQKTNQTMVEQALMWLKPDKNDIVLDLFCGLGNFSLPLAKQVSRVVGVEGVQVMVNKAATNAQANGIENCQFFQADLNNEWLTQPWAKTKFNKVLLDPARAGAEIAIKQVIELGINTLLYVSCEPSTLARDSQLLHAHHYKIDKIGLIDMFSQTKHVETMVLFTKS